MFSHGAFASTGSWTHGAQAAVPASRRSRRTSATGRKATVASATRLSGRPQRARCHLQDAREDDARLRQAAEEEEVHQQRLPGADAVDDEADQEGEAAEGCESQQETPDAR